LQLEIEALRRRRLAVAAVVVDPPETNARLARDLGLSYPILADPELRAIDAYGLRHRGAGPGDADIAHSASILIDAGGVVRWRAIAERVNRRPTPADVLAALDALGAAVPSAVPP
jgi:peroxiredoxin